MKISKHQRYHREKLLNFLALHLVLLLFIGLSVLLSSCSGSSNTAPDPYSNSVSENIDRNTKLPADAVKMSPESDRNPPQLRSDEFDEPIPIPGSVNTAGLEDSPFIMPDGKTLYFFFTPEVNIPPEKQILDGVTGIYVSKMNNGTWNEPERVLLQEPDRLALDGCAFVLGEKMWFCSVREGFSGLQWFNAEGKDNHWDNWELADFDPTYQIGELHITSDGNTLYFHSSRSGGKGGLDIWLSEKVDGEWQEPINVEAVNTDKDEGWPAISPGGNELWFSRDYGIWRSKNTGGEWQEPELIVSQLAAEPSIDTRGNVYFVHHFYENNKMVEADIYIIQRK
jgi:hypothetical protein